MNAGDETRIMGADLNLVRMDIKPSNIEKENKCLSTMLIFFDHLAKGHEHSSSKIIQKFYVPVAMNREQSMKIEKPTRCYN